MTVSRKQKKEREIAAIEAHLRGAFAPVKPRTEFVQVLEEKLSHGVTLDDVRADVRRAIGFGVTAAVGLLGGVLALALGIKAMIELFNLLGLLGVRRS